MFSESSWANFFFFRKRWESQFSSESARPPYMLRACSTKCGVGLINRCVMCSGRQPKSKKSPGLRVSSALDFCLMFCLCVWVNTSWSSVSLNSRDAQHLSRAVESRAKPSPGSPQRSSAFSGSPSSLNFTLRVPVVSLFSAVSRPPPPAWVIEMALIWHPSFLFTLLALQSPS